MNKKNIYRKIIMDNYRNPSNFRKTNPEGYKETNAKSLSCLDHFNIFIKLSNNIIEDILFNGEGCSVSTSALNILSKQLKGRKKNNAIAFIKSFQLFIEKGKTNSIELNDLIVFENVYIHRNRITCALIGANSILNELENDTWI